MGRQSCIIQVKLSSQVFLSQSIGNADPFNSLTAGLGKNHEVVITSVRCTIAQFMSTDEDFTTKKEKLVWLLTLKIEKGVMSNKCKKCTFRS